MSRVILHIILYLWICLWLGARVAAALKGNQNGKHSVYHSTRSSSRVDRDRLSAKEGRISNMAKKNEMIYRIQHPFSHPDHPLPDFRADVEKQLQETGDVYSESLSDFQVLATDDDSPYPQSNCFTPTHSSYSFSNYDYNATSGIFSIDTFNVNPLFCLNYSTPITEPPPCITNQSQLVYIDGLFSSDQTLYNCMANVGDPASAPNFYNGTYHGCLSITTSITLMNLVKIDEIEGTLNLQVIVDMSWFDARYTMPQYWDIVGFSYSGVDLTYLIKNDSVVMWLPEITFPDAQEANVMSASLTLTPDSYFLYEVAYDLTLVQPSFDFRDYPSDTQDLIIRYAVLSYDAVQLQLYPEGIFCSYLADGTCSFSKNAIWDWHQSGGSCTVYYDQKGGGNLIWPGYAAYRVSVERNASGITVRLILPLLLLILLSSLTFWLEGTARVDTTITILLAVSALYIVILQSIPMVGYLTQVDRFVFDMYLLLCMVVCLHQVCNTLSNKIDVWPLRIVYIRFIELLGRVLLPPLIFFCFSTTILKGESASLGLSLILASVFLSLAILTREYFGVISACNHAFNCLRTKVAAEGRTDAEISKAEAAFLNYYLYRRFSRSKEFIIAELAARGEIGSVRGKKDVVLRHMPTLKKLLGGGGDNGDRRKTWDDDSGDGVVNPLSLEMQSFHVDKPVAVHADSAAVGVVGVSVGVEYVDPEMGGGESKEDPVTKDRVGSFRLSTWNLPDSDDEDGEKNK